MKKWIFLLVGVFACWLVLTYGGVRSMCNDGYLSQSFEPGSCSWHGGVKYDVRDLMFWNQTESIIGD